MSGDVKDGPATKDSVKDRGSRACLQRVLLEPRDEEKPPQVFVTGYYAAV